MVMANAVPNMNMVLSNGFCRKSIKAWRMVCIFEL
jgi:hypothetical protein